MLVPVWVAGRDLVGAQRRGPRFRPVGIACVIVIVAQFVLGGKAYYPGGAYTFLLAAGCVPAERWLAARRLAGRADPARGRDGRRDAGRRADRRAGALPVLPARALHTVPVQKINYDLGEGSPGRSRWRWSPASTAHCRPRSGGAPRS